MNSIKRLLLASTVMGMALPTGASALSVYAVSGVYDSGGPPGEGVATTFHCTNGSGGPIDFRLLLLNRDGTVVGNTPINGLPHATTAALSTHDTVFYQEDGLTSPGIAIAGGFALIDATSTALFCTVSLIDASVRNLIPNPVPFFGAPLHLVKFSPLPPAPPSPD
jgi:hypothetical protein